MKIHGGLFWSVGFSPQSLGSGWGSPCLTKPSYIMKTIKIAPDVNECTVSGNEVRTDFAGGVVYRAEGLCNYKPEYVIECFRTAIAMCGKRWVMQDLLNTHLHLDGVVE